jgi:hypothetical protein
MLEPSNLCFSSSMTVDVLRVLILWGLSTKKFPTVYYNKICPASVRNGWEQQRAIRLAPVLVVLSWCSIDLDIIYVTSGVLCTTLIVDEYIQSFSPENKKQRKLNFLATQIDKTSYSYVFLIHPIDKRTLHNDRFSTRWNGRCFTFFLEKITRMDPGQGLASYRVGNPIKLDGSTWHMPQPEWHAWLPEPGTW